jgi:hypothetical protein
LADGKTVRPTKMLQFRKRSGNLVFYFFDNSAGQFTTTI